MCVVYFYLGFCLLLFVGFLFALGLGFFLFDWLVLFWGFLTSEGEDRGDASSFCCWRISLQKIPSCSDVFIVRTVLSSINEFQSQEGVNQPMSGDVCEHLVHKTPFRALIGPDNHCLITPEQEHWAPLLW